MKTRSPISTISYNTASFLKGKLRELVQQKILEFWAIIEHEPEDDEAGRKEHFHVYMIPNKQIDTLELRDMFKEYDPVWPDKPKGCLLIRSSKRFGDWALYAIHDPVYLASKHQSRRYAYEIEQIMSDDKDTLNMLIKEIEYDDLSKYVNMDEAQKKGKSFVQYVTEYNIPVQQIGSYMIAWNALFDEATFRNGRKNHEQEK